MEGSDLVALLGVAFAFAGVLVTALVTQLRSRLEARRLQHEKQKWILELHSGLEKRLHEVRLEEYPSIFQELERLSHFRIEAETPESLRILAGKLNAWGYGRAGLCMSSRTRDALFQLRYSVSEYAAGRIDAETLMRDPRTDLVEWMRRDLNHSVSTWRDLAPLLVEIQSVAVPADEIS